MWKKVTMPAVVIQKKEKKAHFVKVSGKETAASRAATEVLRGVDPLVVWPRKVTTHKLRLAEGCLRSGL